MNLRPDEPRAASGSKLERAIVLRLLSEDGARRSSRTELASELAADALGLETALHALHGQGVLCLSERDVWASPATRRLDELGLIAI
jgi:hypothetical protein